MAYVIVSECEGGFWSNQYGWVHDKASASVFSNVGEFPLPLRARHEGSFIDASLAPEFFLDEPLLCGDEGVWKNPNGGSYAPASADVALRNHEGTTLEAVACAVAYASPAATGFEA